MPVPRQTPVPRLARLALVCAVAGGALVLGCLGLRLQPPQLHCEVPAAEIRHEGGLCYHVARPLTPAWLWASDTTGRPVSRLALLEDGRHLGPAHADHDQVRTAGTGAFSHWHGSLWFSSSDGSDPRDNGRRYAVAVPFVPGLGWLWTGSSLCGLGGVLGLGHRLRRYPDPLARLRRTTGSWLIGLTLLLLAGATFAWLQPIQVRQTVAATAPGAIDLFGQRRAWQLPPFCVGLWPANVHAEQAGPIGFDLPVVPSPGLFALLAVLGVTGLWLRWPRRTPQLRSPWCTLGLLSLQGLAPAAATLLALTVAGRIDRPLRAPLDEAPIESSFGGLDRTLDWPDCAAEFDRRDGESEAAFVRRLTEAVADGVAHVWDRRFARTLRLQVPARENWLLWLLGEVDATQREYFFVDPARAIERGIGMCGQVAHAHGELLVAAGFDARLVQLGGHTVVRATVDGREWLLDPDYRVVLPHALAELAADPALARPAYEAALQRLGLPDASALAAQVAALYDPAGNSIDARRPRDTLPGDAVARETWAYRLAWSLPLSLLALWFAAELVARRGPR